jgi:hypothetical protein
MNPDIWVVRDGDGYRLLHGHLHLAVEMAKESAVYVDIRNEGEARIVKTSGGYAVERDCRRDLLNK